MEQWNCFFFALQTLLTSWCLNLPTEGNSIGIWTGFCPGCTAARSVLELLYWTWEQVTRLCMTLRMTLLMIFRKDDFFHVHSDSSDGFRSKLCQSTLFPYSFAAQWHQGGVTETLCIGFACFSLAGRGYLAPFPTPLLCFLIPSIFFPWFFSCFLLTMVVIYVLNSLLLLSCTSSHSPSSLQHWSWWTPVCSQLMLPALHQLGRIAPHFLSVQPVVSHRNRQLQAVLFGSGLYSCLKPRNVWFFSRVFLLLQLLSHGMSASVSPPFTSVLSIFFVHLSITQVILGTELDGQEGRDAVLAVTGSSSSCRQLMGEREEYMGTRRMVATGRQIHVSSWK